MRRDGPVTAVAFDLGGVLTNWDPRNLFSEVIADDEVRERFLTTVCSPEWNRLYDLGRPFSELVPSLIEAHPGFEAEIRAYAERFDEMFAGPIPESVALLERLVAGHVPCYAASNVAVETYEWLAERFGFMALFSGALVSGEVHVAKPDVAFFELLASRFGLEPSATLFVDDNEDNVVAAASVGFVARRFVSAHVLADELASLRLLGGSR